MALSLNVDSNKNNLTEIFSFLFSMFEQERGQAARPDATIVSPQGLTISLSGGGRKRRYLLLRMETPINQQKRRPGGAATGSQYNRRTGRPQHNSQTYLDRMLAWLKV